jgi:cobalt/nickel transport system permease protein
VASRWSEPRRSRALVLGWLAAAFALSAATDVRVLAAAGAAALLAFRRGLVRNLRRTARSVVPVSVGLSAASWALLYAVERARPDAEPFLALALRTAVIAFVGFAVLDRANLFRALEPWPAATRLLVVTLAQIHALRLLATDSLQGLRSRLVRKPGARDVLRGAGGITAAMFALSARNAREISEAMRSRGFS